MSVDEAELLARIEAAEPDQMDGTAACLFRAAGELETRYAEVRGVRSGGAHLWKGAAATAWGDRLEAAASRLSLAAYGFRQVGGALQDMAGAARKAKAEVGAAEVRLREAVFFPDGDPQQTRVRQALAARQAATEEFHAAEQRVRTRLWQLGDLADVGPPPRVEVVDPPPPGVFERVFGSPPGPVRTDAEGNPQAYDEDGALVPGYRGDVAARLEVLEWGVAGLGKVVPRLAAALRGVSGLEARVQRVMEDVRSSYAWRASHRDRHIREWYGKSRIDPYMEPDFARLVAEATVRGRNTFRWRLKADDAVAVLYEVPGTRRTLAVFFHKGGKYDGEFMSAYEVKGSQLAEMTRARQRFPVR
jgi:uncharacterized protein YukE